eukprot:TRINITY_DN60928_c0_g1_i1.p2 TRINITY_DN60928_c0_g1~~TRINITY_DN60928_c0_g1_i1.p2  ORF type:complete len:244 (+),score=119.00 TRINITY_DN60928_c0_g1_i1:143-874(+)
MSDHDLDANVYSPDGKVMQIDYACKAVDNTGTGMGVCCKDGVVLGIEKLIISRMIEPGANSRVQAIDTHQGCVVGGLLPDGRHLVMKAREEARQFNHTYGIPVTGDMLVQRLCSYIHFFTISWYRPFGAALMIASYGRDGPQLYISDPHGQKQSFHACAMGKAATRAKTELEKIDFKSITCREALDVIARLLHEVHDQQKDKKFEFELAWITDANGRKFERVPKELSDEVLKKGKETAKISET